MGIRIWALGAITVASVAACVSAPSDDGGSAPGVAPSREAAPLPSTTSAAPSSAGLPGPRNAGKWRHAWPTAGGAETAPTPDIENGRPVNSDGDWVDALFPYLTVELLTPLASGKTGVCTGVIIASNLILTAAHCTFTKYTTVTYYGGSDAGLPIETTGIFSAVTVPPAYPPGVTGKTGVGTTGLTTSATQGINGYPGYNSGDFADLAILTLTAKIPLQYPYKIADLGPIGGYASNVGKSAWEVGAGNHNGVVNETNAMDWVAVSLSSRSDSGGWFQTDIEDADQGDSGGPIFGLGPNGLFVIGICSGQYFLTQNRYSSVQYAPTYNWIQGQIALAAPAPNFRLETHREGVLQFLPSEDDGELPIGRIELGGHRL